MFNRASKEAKALATAHNEYLKDLIKVEHLDIQQIEAKIKEENALLKNLIQQERLKHFDAELTRWIAEQQFNAEFKNIILEIVKNLDPENPVADPLVFRINDQKKVVFPPNWVGKLQIFANKIDEQEKIPSDEKYALQLNVVQVQKKKILQLENQLKKFELDGNRLQTVFLATMKKPNILEKTIENLFTTAKANNKKIELLLVAENKVDMDLIKVIQMRANVSQQKNNGFIVIPYQAFEAMMDNKPKIQFKGLTKLSYLHHALGNIDDSNFFYKDYLNKITLHVKQMPDLKNIVLRGCRTADKVKKEKEKKAEHPFHTIKMLSLDKDIQQIPLQGNAVLFQQKINNDRIETYVKFKDKDQQAIKKLENIHAVKKVADLSPEELKIISTACNGIALKPPSENKQESPNKSFFNPEMTLTQAQRKKAKQDHLRARTQETKDFGDNEESLAKKVYDKLNAAKCYGITIKAYIGGYQAGVDRAIPITGHGFITQPKARRVTTTSLPPPAASKGKTIR